MAVEDVLENTNTEEKLEKTDAVNTEEAIQVETAKNTTGADFDIINDDKTQPNKDLDENAVTAWLKERGVLTEEATLDSLKPKIEKTDEQIKIEENAKTKEVLDEYLSKGGSAEEFVNIQKLTKLDETELGFSALRQQYKDAGFTESAIEEALKVRHFQLTDEEIEELDYDDKDEVLKNKEFYALQAKQLGEQIKNSATSTLNNLQQSIEAKKVEAEIEKSISGELEQFALSSPKLELKSIDSGTDAFKFEDFTLDYSKEEIEEVVNKLKDRSTREQIFYNKTNAAENVTFIADLMLRANKAEKAYQDGLIRGANAINEYYKNTYLSSQNIPVRQQQSQPTSTGSKVTPTGIKQIR